MQQHITTTNQETEGRGEKKGSKDALISNHSEAEHTTAFWQGKKNKKNAN